MTARHRDGLAGNADEAAPHPAVPDQFAQHDLRGIAGDRKADALRAHDDRGVDADHVAMRGDQRPARIAGIERGVGLDHVLDQAAGLRTQRAAERGDHARGDGRFKPERIADRDHELAAPQRLGVAERRGRQVAHGIGAQQREIGVGILAQQPRLHHAAFGIGQPQFARALDHMAVGQDETVRRDDDAGADAAGRAAVAVLAGLDPHHGGTDAIGDADHGMGIGIEQRRIARGTIGIAARDTSSESKKPCCADIEHGMHSQSICAQSADESRKRTLGRPIPPAALLG